MTKVAIPPVCPNCGGYNIDAWDDTWQCDECGCGPQDDEEEREEPEEHET